MQIVAKELSYTYSKKSKDLAAHALKSVTLTVEEGDFFGIIGHTGSGKSTFVQHLNGLLKMGKNCGSLTVGEYNLADKKCDFKGLRSKVGMVFQYPEHQLFAESVKQDVAFGLNNFKKALSQEQKDEKIKRALELVGLDYEKVKDKSPFELSGGQKRRVAIAGVLVTEPEILVLDEPAAGLDPQGKREFIELLHRLKKEVVKTIIIVSHDMNLVSENCNKVAVFNNGQVEICGTPKEIFSLGERLTQMGLEIPLTAYLVQELKNMGVEVDCDLTVDGLINAVLGYEKSTGGAL